MVGSGVGNGGGVLVDLLRGSEVTVGCWAIAVAGMIDGNGSTVSLTGSSSVIGLQATTEESNRPSNRADQSPFVTATSVQRRDACLS
jgi:hypothetical protein